MPTRPHALRRSADSGDRRKGGEVAAPRTRAEGWEHAGGWNPAAQIRAGRRDDAGSHPDDAAAEVGAVHGPVPGMGGRG